VASVAIAVALAGVVAINEILNAYQGYAAALNAKIDHR